MSLQKERERKREREREERGTLGRRIEDDEDGSDNRLRER